METRKDRSKAIVRKFAQNSEKISDAKLGVPSQKMAKFLKLFLAKLEKELQPITATLFRD